jgi:hypothetical protein
MLRSKLIQPPLGHIGWRVGIIMALAWLPLVPLTLLDGSFAGGVKVPFLYDFEVQTRLLFALPLLILAEGFVYIRMRAITTQFIERQIITPEVRPAFDRVVASAMRLRDSVSVEIGLLLVVLVAGPYLRQESRLLHSDTWYAVVGGGGVSYTPAGLWYMYFSVAVFQFILLRWYFRIFIWYRFLFQVSRLELNLEPLHPDYCCGLGFLGTVASAFAPLLMAHSGLVSGFIANRIIHEGAHLPDYKFELVGLTAFLLLLVLGPLCVFTPKLNRARIGGLRTYGRLASDYVVAFRKKWAAGADSGGEPLLGTADIQSLADLNNSFAIVSGTKLAPFGKEAVIRFLVVIALPLAPLAFTMFSAEELLKRLLSIVL